MDSGPIIRHEEPGKKAWCTCGLSENRPYCDGSHARCGSGKQPKIVEITEAQKVAWCGCGKTANQPFCDGSHTG